MFLSSIIRALCMLYNIENTIINYYWRLYKMKKKKKLKTSTFGYIILFRTYIIYWKRKKPRNYIEPRTRSDRVRLCKTAYYNKGQNRVVRQYARVQGDSPARRRRCERVCSNRNIIIIYYIPNGSYISFLSRAILLQNVYDPYFIFFIFVLYLSAIEGSMSLISTKLASCKLFDQSRPTNSPTNFFFFYNE